MYFVLCDGDLAKGGRFWINMFARRDSFDYDSSNDFAQLFLLSIFQQE